MGGVKGTRYLLPIDFCNIRTQKMLSSKCEKVIKNNFRILKTPHVYLLTILKASVKFQKYRTKTVGGVKETRYLLKIRNHAPHATHHVPCTTRHGKPKTVSLHFSSKRRGTIIKFPSLFVFLSYRKNSIGTQKLVPISHFPSIFVFLSYRKNSVGSQK